MWSTTEYLLAAVVDLLAGIQWAYTIVHLDADAVRPPYPTPVPRPGVQAEPDAGGSGSASVYEALGDVPAASLTELRQWLSP